MAIRAAMRPYSMAVAPDSSFTKRSIRPCMMFSQTAGRFLRAYADQGYVAWVRGVLTGPWTWRDRKRVISCRRIMRKEAPRGERRRPLRLVSVGALHTCERCNDNERAAVLFPAGALVFAWRSLRGTGPAGRPAKSYPRRASEAHAGSRQRLP
jgi:hypothetical protein